MFLFCSDHYKHVSLLQSVWYLVVLISPNTDNTIKQTNKIILLIYFLNPVIYCDQRPVTKFLLSQSCSFFNCSITRGKYITLPMFLTSYIIEENKLRLKITQEPHTKEKKNPTEKLTFHMFQECKQQCNHTDMQKTGVTQTRRCQFSI